MLVVLVTHVRESRYMTAAVLCTLKEREIVVLMTGIVIYDMLVEYLNCRAEGSLRMRHELLGYVTRIDA